MSFTHLHVHTEYSLLDGFSNIKKLVKRAKEMDMSSLAITDHGTMFGVAEFFFAAQDAGIKPIIGLETYVSARGMHDRDAQKDKHSFHLVLLAENETGYKNLLQIASAAQLEGFYYYPRVDHDFLREHSQGLIASTSCMSGEVPRTILNKGVEAGRQMLSWYIDTFGVDNFFIELQSHNIPELPALNRTLLDLGKQFNLKTIATNDSHYINREDARLQDILLCIQTGALISDPNRMRMTGDSYYLRSPQEMAALFPDNPEALANTLLIAERCNVDLSMKGYHLPRFDVPDGFTPESYLRKLCEEGLKRRYGDRASDAKVRERLEYELSVIHQMGFNAYFLIVWDLCKYAAQNGVWYNARGSGEASIVAYSLDITLIEPLTHGLIFERFLSPSRISMPDIDLDFQDDKRGMIMEYCAKRYGADRVAQIITFGTMGARGSIRDVGRVMDIPLSEVDRVSKAVPNNPGQPMTLMEAVVKDEALKAIYNESDYIHDLIDTASKMEGAVRNAGTHAAGVVITDIPLVEYAPLHRPTSGSEDSPIKTVTQFEMNIVDKLGLLKVDFLGLSTLTVMQRACDFIRERREVVLNLYNIPLDDPETYEFIGHGHTAGVFQLEGNGMTRWLLQMKPHDLDNIIAMVALFRPGPMEFIPSYVKRMHGEEEITYRHPAMEQDFKDTYGIPIYQEQLMYAAMHIANYTASESDELRKAISKKNAEAIQKHKKMFSEGAAKNGVPIDVAVAIFEDWENFARYGFNKSHAADYGVIAVETAYLKTHYTVEYMTALLSASKNDMAKIAFYVADCRSLGIEVLAPDINSSGWDFTIEDCEGKCAAIRFGMGAVKNVGQAPVELIITARKDGKFKDLNDFLRRVDLRQVGKRSLECLIRVGALDCYGPRKALMEVMDNMIALSSSHFRALQSGQMSFFGNIAGVEESIHLPPVTDLDPREQLDWEKELIGLYVSDHPLNRYTPFLKSKVTHFSADLGETNPNQKVTVAGLVTKMRTLTTKTGKLMAFATIEDLQGTIELVIFPNTWTKYSGQIHLDGLVIVDGKIDATSNDPKVLVDSIKPIGEKDLEGIDLSSIPEPQTGPQEIYETNSSEQPSVENFSEFNSNDLNDLPPPPMEPDDWHLMPPPVDSIAARSDAASAVATTAAVAVMTEPTRAQAAVDTTVLERPTAQSAIGEMPPLIVAPRVAESRKRDPQAETRMVTVVLKATGEKERDVRRLKRVHGLLRANPGTDHFCLMIHENGSRHFLDFPNDTTGVNPDLLNKLVELVGSENVQVEDLRLR